MGKGRQHVNHRLPVAEIVVPPVKTEAARLEFEQVQGIDPSSEVAAIPLGPFLLSEAIRAEHEARHEDAAAIRISDRCLGEFIMSLPASIEHSDGDLRQRLIDIQSFLTR